jgi:hypothetical protein
MLTMLTRQSLALVVLLALASLVAATGANAGGPSTPIVTSPSRPFVKQKSFRVSWSASTAEAGIKGYDVRYRRARWNGRFGSFVTWRSLTPARRATFIGSPGSTYCFSVRAIDLGGSASEWSAERCTAIPLDDRALRARGGWSRERGRGYYLKTYSLSFTRGAALVRRGVVAKRLALIATKCDSGTVKVYWKGTLLKRINLASRVVRKKQLFRLATFPAVETGTVRIVVASRRMPVEIEGLGVSAV